MFELNDDFWKFVDENLNSDPSALRLKYHGKAGIGFDVGFAIVQIECRRKFSKKFAETLAAFPRFIFPSTLAGEQATSDSFAGFHTSIIEQLKSPTKKLRMADLTAGLGIDVFHVARFMEEVVAVELDTERAACLRHNAAGLNIRNITVVEGDCCKFLADDSNGRFDAVFIDPARRAADGSRVFALSDCQPDVVALMPMLQKMADRIIIKMSPMLDISQISRELPLAIRIIALGTPTECRELVAVIDGSEMHESVKLSGRMIEAVTLGDSGKKVFAVDCEQGFEPAEHVTSSFDTPARGDILFEPYPAVMKVGAWQMFAERYGLKTLSANSHLFFKKESDTDMEYSLSASHIPAAMLDVLEVLPYQSKVIKRFKKEYPKISITCRNFDLSPEMLRKKLGVTDGGNLRLFATKNSAGTPLLIVSRSSVHYN